MYPPKIRGIHICLGKKENGDDELVAKITFQMANSGRLVYLTVPVGDVHEATVASLLMKARDKFIAQLDAEKESMNMMAWN